MLYAHLGGQPALNAYAGLFRRMTRPTVQVTTLGDLLLRAAERWPSHDALVFPDGRRTYEELWAGAERVGRGLLALGVQPGEHVGILMANCIEFAEAFFGAAAIGAVAVPLNARYRSHELAYVVENADLVALLTSDLVAEHVDHVERIREGLPSSAAPPIPPTCTWPPRPACAAPWCSASGPRDGFARPRCLRAPWPTASTPRSSRSGGCASGSATSG